jgi:enoyl-CoA hydratase
MLRVTVSQGTAHPKVAEFCLCRPEQRNALSLAMLEAIASEAHAMRSHCRQDGVRAVILRAQGSAFAAGGDLRELENRLSTADGEALAEAGFAACEALVTLPVPVIAVICGPAIGGGAELAMAADFRVFSATGAIAFRHGRLGITTAWGTFARLRAVVGPQAARRLLMTGDAMDGRASHAFGLADELRETAVEADAIANALAMSIAESSFDVVASYKDQFQAYARESQANPREREAFVRLWPTEEHVRRMASALRPKTQERV